MDIRPFKFGVFILSQIGLILNIIFSQIVLILNYLLVLVWFDMLWFGLIWLGLYVM